ncbi:hypothetical protein DFO83_111104 [Idiomarina loihiensis]|uniref:hypothetical protein n=1 Tax=Idiomarina TaxID=135575 RepID=UPI000D71A5CB|nr:hypothetical protein [Idiomarina]PWW34577.1 hypothetical protein DFO83_111104 [Idiomarina loihiensis]TDP43713.1 hypothetical protein DET58_11810 [Idiomarina loihiensis]TDS18456.1 hypothetical protein DET62_1182 [Idiomarina sp. H2]
MKFLAGAVAFIMAISTYFVLTGAPQLAFGVSTYIDCKDKEMDYAKDVFINPMPRSQNISKERKKTVDDIKTCYKSIVDVAKTTPLSAHSLERIEK